MFPKAAVRTSQEIIPKHLKEKNLIYCNLERGKGEKYKQKVVKSILFYFVKVVKGHRLFLMSNLFHFMINGFVTVAAMKLRRCFNKDESSCRRSET